MEIPCSGLYIGNVGPPFTMILKKKFARTKKLKKSFALLSDYLEVLEFWQLLHF